MFAGILLIKPVPGHELKLSIGTGQRCFEASMQKAGGLDHDHARGAAIRCRLTQRRSRYRERAPGDGMNIACKMLPSSLGNSFPRLGPP
jgi:hypothetical protein